MRKNQRTFYAALLFRLLPAFAAAALAFGCQNSLSPAAATGTVTAGNTGALTITIPAIASWLEAYQAAPAANETALSGPRTRALARATSVKIEILQSDGTTPVMAPTTVNLTTSVPGATATTTLQVIPVGTGYTVKISVFNSAVSTTVPVVIGTATGIAVTQNATNPLTVSCLPNSPATMTVGTAASTTLPGYAEQWYSASVTSGATYYVSQLTPNCVFGIFDATGAYIGSNANLLSYTATYTGTLYLVSVNNASGSASPSPLITTTAPVWNEGSVATPVSLASNTSHTFKAGPSAAQGTSYYSFTTTTTGTYALDTANYSSYSATLYSNSTYTTSVSTTTSATNGAVFSGLAATTTYYLKLVNNTSSVLLSVSGQILDPIGISADTSSEGSVSAPVALTVDTPWAGKVGAHIYRYASYYTFTTGSGVDYRLTLSSVAPAPSTAVTVTLFSNAAFTTSLGSFTVSASSVPGLDFILSASTAYYVAVTSSTNNSALGYSLKIATITPTVLAVSGIYTSGSITIPGTYAWFVATVVGGQTYSLNWDDSYSGSGAYSLDVRVSAYQADRTTTYISGVDSGFTAAATQAIAVPAGQTTFYVKVGPFTSGNTGTFALKLTGP